MSWTTTREEIAARPRIEVPRTFTDHVIELVGWAVLVAFIAFGIYAYTSTPVVSVTSGVGKGTILSGSNRVQYLILALIGILLFFGLRILTRYPHRFNYLTRITKENAPRQYAVAVRMIRLAMCFTTLEFLFICISIFLEEQLIIQSSTPLILVATMGVSMIPMFYFLIASQSKGKERS